MPGMDSVVYQSLPTCAVHDGVDVAQQSTCQTVNLSVWSHQQHATADATRKLHMHHHDPEAQEGTARLPSYTRE